MGDCACKLPFDCRKSMPNCHIQTVEAQTEGAQVPAECPERWEGVAVSLRGW